MKKTDGVPWFVPTTDGGKAAVVLSLLILCGSVVLLGVQSLWISDDWSEAYVRRATVDALKESPEFREWLSIERAESRRLLNESLDAFANAGLNQWEREAVRDVSVEAMRIP